MIKNEFTLEALADSVTKHDTWELLGNPTETLVAEAIIKTCDRNMWTPEGEHRELPLDELVEELSDWQGITTAAALSRITEAIESKEVLCWLGDDVYVVCVNRYEAQRLKARWAFTRLCTWAVRGTCDADEAVRRVGLHQAIASYEAGFPTRSVVLPLAKHVGLTHEQAFQLLNSDGWDDDLVSPYVRKYGSSDDAIRTKRRMGMRIIDYLRTARRTQQSLDS